MAPGVLVVTAAVAVALAAAAVTAVLVVLAAAAVAAAVLVVPAEAAVLAAAVRAAVVACCHLSAWSRSLLGSYRTSQSDIFDRPGALYRLSGTTVTT